MGINITGSIEDIKKYMDGQNDMISKIDLLDKVRNIIRNNSSRMKKVESIDCRKVFDYETIGKEIVHLLDEDKKSFEYIILNPYGRYNDQ